MIKDPIPIRLVVFDIDGVLSDGETEPLDLELMARLARLNRAARQDSSLPAVTLCTGRPASYVEIMLQAIDSRLPAIFENGAGLYVPDGYRFLPHPDINNSLDYQTAYRRLEERLVRTGRAYFQPGKEYSLSIFAANPADTPALHTWAIEALGPLKTTVELSYAASCLNVLPRGLDKASGLAFLTQQTGYRPAEMLGVGDSDSDLPFLAKTGYSAAPANANSAVKQAVQYVSPYQTTAGVRDILARFGIGEA